VVATNLNNSGFVLEPVDVLVAVSVATLQNLDKLFVQTLHDRQETTSNLKKS
jgi:hypothetical protein